VDRQRDKLQEDQRHGGSRELWQGRSKVRVHYDSTVGYDSEEYFEYGRQEISHDGRVIIQYDRPGRVRQHNGLRYDVKHVLEPRSPSNYREEAAIGRPVEGRVSIFMWRVGLCQEIRNQYNANSQSQ